MIVVPCNSCGMPLPEWDLSAGEISTCPDCGSENKVKIFPAALRLTPSIESESAEEGDAACFDHPASRAIASCAQCGRFVCQLCAVELTGNTYCPSCISTGVSKVAGRNVSAARVAFDSIALSVALVPLLFFPITLFTGPVAVFLAVRYWKRPLVLMHANRWRFVAAIAIGLVEVGGLGWLMLYGLLKRAAAGV
jgi:uncharacterized Zn finger protein (UPF0148 family)